tara:strand:+ start:27 stop:500 length:474 start_codon:yes stop_codon:yes gene_type:complete
MKVEVRVPGWVDSDNEGILILFAFLRKITIQYRMTNKPIDMYGHDLRRILDREDRYINNYIHEHVDTNFCTVGRLNGEHFMFKANHWMQHTQVVEIKDPANQLKWAYLLGCTNWNLFEEDRLTINNRPHYTPMYTLEREVFGFNAEDRKSSTKSRHE